MNGVGGDPQLWFVVVGKILVEKSVTGRSGGGAASMDSAGAYAGMLAAVCTWPRQPAVRSVLGRWGGGVGRRVCPTKKCGFVAKNGRFCWKKKKNFLLAAC